MEEITQKLLEECCTGCRMAINSMNQVNAHVNGEALKKTINDCKVEHEKLEKRAEKLLISEGEKTKDPGLAATAFSWISAEMKLKMHDDNTQVSKIMMDGCNMGIQSISENLNKYKAASRESKEIAEEIVRIEEKFMKELKEFL